MVEKYSQKAIQNYIEEVNDINKQKANKLAKVHAVKLLSALFEKWFLY